MQIIFFLPAALQLCFIAGGGSVINRACHPSATPFCGKLDLDAAGQAMHGNLAIPRQWHAAKHQQGGSHAEQLRSLAHAELAGVLPGR